MMRHPKTLAFVVVVLAIIMQPVLGVAMSTEEVSSGLFFSGMALLLAWRLEQK